VTKRKTTLTLAAILSLILACSPLLPSEAKKWTVTQRLEKISKEIDEGRVANELTVKQVDSLKNEISDIKNRMETMKTKNANKLSIPDTNKIHKELNDISVRTLKLRLENVYEK
jgi:septal ring factor EnvC (AmiA/AmiB activator)